MNCWLYLPCHICHLSFQPERLKARHKFSVIRSFVLTSNIYTPYLSFSAYLSLSVSLGSHNLSIYKGYRTQSWPIIGSMVHLPWKPFGMVMYVYHISLLQAYPFALKIDLATNFHSRTRTPLHLLCQKLILQKKTAPLKFHEKMMLVRRTPR